jgi:hypothetical protein
MGRSDMKFTRGDKRAGLTNAVTRWIEWEEEGCGGWMDGR